MEAIILAGGLGTRLRSVVSEVPKCMAPVDGRPFLQYMLEWLQRFDITHVILSVGYLREVIFNYIDSRNWPFEISYAVEEEPLGTGGGIRLALMKCHGDRVIVLNGDTFFQVDLDRLAFDAPVTLALKPMRNFDRYGAVDWDGKLVTGFREKAVCTEGLINGGIYAIERSQLDFALFPKRFSFEKDMLEPLAAGHLVAGQVQDGYFIDIGIPEDYARAQRELPHQPLAPGRLCRYLGQVHLPSRDPGVPSEMGRTFPPYLYRHESAGCRKGADDAGTAGCRPCSDALGNLRRRWPDRRDLPVYRRVGGGSAPQAQPGHVR